MDRIPTAQIRNICLLGHSGSGKTSLAEALLYLTKTTDRLGNPADGNTVCDYDPEEIKRGFSISDAIAPVMHKGCKINIIDTPGYLDFAGDVHQAIRVADSSVIVIDGKAGVEVGTELAWDYATAAGVPKSFFVNKFDDPECRFNRVFKQIRERFGVSVCPLMIPLVEGDAVTGFINLVDLKTMVYDKSGNHSDGVIPEEYSAVVAEYREMLLESIAGTSDELMEKFFAGKEITYEESIEAIHNGIIHGSIVPVLCGSALKTWGVITLADTIAESYPRHTAKKVEHAVDGSEIPIDKEGEDTAIYVFKTVADPFVGKMSFFKVMNGTLKKDMVLKNLSTDTREKMSRIFVMRGKKQIEVDELSCGDIGMTAKLQNTNTNDTLASNPDAKPYAKTVYPVPYLTLAISPKSKGDEDKIASGMSKLLEEDYTIRFENNAETKQLLVSGLGDIHLDVLTSKLKNGYNVDVTLSPQKIAYRETIKKTVQAEGKHKKQSGGHGQYGHVKITFSPGEGDGLTFTESVVGGAVPKGFFPAVEKGLLDSMKHGVLAGFPVVGLKADLYDGSYHDVDSSEMAFKLAAALAYKEGLPKADPVILEPVGELKTTVPEELVGDVMGDINKRRGRVLGINHVEGKSGYSMIDAEVPKAEMADYLVSLRAISRGKGSFDYKFVRYEEVPALEARKIIEKAKVEE